jgi:hypothetical protein
MNVADENIGHRSAFTAKSSGFASGDLSPTAPGTRGIQWVYNLPTQP